MGGVIGAAALIVPAMQQKQPTRKELLLLHSERQSSHSHAQSIRGGLEELVI